MTFRYPATAFLSVLVTIIIFGCGGGGGSSPASRNRGLGKGITDASGSRVLRYRQKLVRYQLLSEPWRH